jgi:threonine dehydrogenase-like Zn-dependent dehydrogenase
VPLLQTGRLDVEGIFTTSFPLEAAADGYATAFARSGEHLKIRLNP